MQQWLLSLENQVAERETEPPSENGKLSCSVETWLLKEMIGEIKRLRDLLAVTVDIASRATNGWSKSNAETRDIISGP